MACGCMMDAVLFLSTLSLRRATGAGPAGQGHPAISIHALLAESDGWQMTRWNGWNEFLSTLSLRRATRREARESIGTLHFYPRSPCGERPWQRGSRITYVEFLSTLSLRRATHQTYHQCQKDYRFLSTLSLRRATRSAGPWQAEYRDFYPRSPCGERRNIGLAVMVPPTISIHALLAESDIIMGGRGTTISPFLSTLSLRRATDNRITLVPHQQFLSTLSLRRATRPKL